MAIEGDACITYDSPLVTHNLQQPMVNIEPVRRGVRASATAIDQVTIETVVVTSGVNEILGTFRYETDPKSLLDALEFGADGGTITYKESCASGPSFPCAVIEPSGNEIKLLRDSQLGHLDEYEVRVRLRRTDGGNFDSLLT